MHEHLAHETTVLAKGNQEEVRRTCRGEVNSILSLFNARKQICSFLFTGHIYRNIIFRNVL